MSDIDLGRLFEKIDKMDANVSAMNAKIDAYIARTDERLDHGSDKLDDHEKRLRVLESSHDQGRGRMGLLTVLLSLAGSSTAAVLISLLLTRGH